jgi:N-acylneuraminate cytidylyltransferase
MILNGKVLAVTLARGGSKGIPRKNMVDLCGRPLISYTIEVAKRIPEIDRYVVSSDSKKILDYAKACGVSTIKRPRRLATDRARSADALIHALDTAEFEDGINYEYVIELMPTNPLRTEGHILESMLYLGEPPFSPSVVSVVEVGDYHPARLKYMDPHTKMLIPFFPEVPESRRQDLRPRAYIRNGSIYAVRADYLRRREARTGPETVGFVVPADESINIDTPIDLKLAEIMINEQIS